MTRSKVFPARFRGKCACCEHWFETGDDVQYVDGELCLAGHMTEAQEAARDALSARMRRELEEEAER